MIQKKHMLLVAGFVESFIYTGMVFGWATLNYMLREECVFSHLCQVEPANETQKIVSDTEKVYVGLYNGNLDLVTQNASIETISACPVCPQQEKMLNLAFNFSICFGAFSGFIWGYILDKFGIRVLRLLISFFVTGGALMLMFTNKDLPFLLFPAMTFCSLIGVPVRISCLQVAELFPAQRSTLITLYSGANTASAAAFTFLKYPYDYGYSWQITMSIFVGATFLAIPFTFFLFPAMNFEQLKHPKKKNMETVSKSVAIKDDYQNKVVAKPVEAIKTDPNSMPLCISLISVSSLLYNFWISWLMLYSLYYNGSLSLWVARTTNNPKDLATYVEILGISQLAAVVIAPLGGVLIDYSLRRVKNITPTTNEPGSLPQRMIDQVGQVRATFLAVLLTTLMLTGTQICKFFDNTNAILASMFFFILFRSTVIGVSTTYLRERFLNQHFNKLVGFTATVRSLTFLLQFPLFVWESDDPLGVNTLCLVCLAISFVLPLHLLTPLLPFLMKREDKVVNRIYDKNTNKIENELIVTHM